MQALQSFHRFQPVTNCRAWVVTILQHVRSNRRRTHQRSPLVDDPDDRIANTIPFVAHRRTWLAWRTRSPGRCLGNLPAHELTFSAGVE
jgi:DNA-directed RNA polymerase specialized sigma24 family protein